MMVMVFGMANVPVLPAGYMTIVVLSLLYSTPSCELKEVLAELTLIAERLVQP